ncbi:MAG TPA: Asp-tRNA(Asn)/Glu-tRNA(Gln) amidotransferase subunit GatB [Candidatus Saccharimonadales bacterium]|nr:Asp-tRNA(Asn)/Glu-tRNA(Gln) amidotransferase subunit GatB [Candidatus Saccharimonadales bacterium]
MTKTTDYQATIGIECHVQLSTRTKLFAAVGNDAREAEPNTLISYICLGMPGALPVLNEKVVELASRAAFALGTKPEHFSKFDRKHYFYPDLPKGYQITQFEQPIVAKGEVEIVVDGQTKTIGITRAHLEEDAGKSTHPIGKDYSLVDLNRAGTPLLEIVSEPDMHTAAEAKAYARELYLLAKFAGISDADLYHGNMRFDVNVSVSKDPAKLGTRSETKNLNSFKSVEKAVEYEVKRQTELLEKGGTVVQETRGWDDAKQKTFSQRGKEEAHDYRYMPEPDVPPVVLTKEYIEAIEAEMPVLPPEWRKRLASLGLGGSYVDTLLEAEVDDELTSYLGLIEENLKDKDFCKSLANWFVNIEIPMRRDGKVSSELKDGVRNNLYEALHKLVKTGSLSATNAKALLTNLLEAGIAPENMEKYAEEQGLIQVSNEGEIIKIVEQVIKENPQAAEDIKNGEMKAIGFLVGQVMRKSQGKANPGLAQELIKKQLS